MTGRTARVTFIGPIRLVVICRSICPAVGELSLSFNRLDIAADHGLTMFTYAAEPGSRSEEALNLLGSWAATFDRAETARTTDQS